MNLIKSKPRDNQKTSKNPKEIPQTFKFLSINIQIQLLLHRKPVPKLSNCKHLCKKILGAKKTQSNYPFPKIYASRTTQLTPDAHDSLTQTQPIINKLKAPTNHNQLNP